MMIVCSFAVCCCLLLHRYDNKYTASGPHAQNGVLRLDDDMLQLHPVIFLTDGWEFYRSRLLSPTDFAETHPAPDEIIYIGQYGGFESGDVTASPHGSASYRLTILLSDKPCIYSLELPEIFSAYKLHINGELIAEMGEPKPEHYRPETGNRSISVQVSEKLEILISVSDFSHLYSGLVYPPAFGEPKAVGALLGARLIFRSLLAAFTAAIGLISVFIGLLNRKNKPILLYGLLCIFFTGYTAYPLWQNFPGDHRFLYALENTSFYAMLVVVMLLQKILYGAGTKVFRANLYKRLSWVFIGFGLFVCAISLIVPFILPQGNLQLMFAYSDFITVYMWITVGFLTITAARVMFQHPTRAKPLLCGMLALDVALIMDRLLPLHEPIITGWFPEMAGFTLVLCIGVSVGQETAAAYMDRAVLTERADSTERLLRMQRTSYALLSEKIEETRSILHDFRHHMMVMDGYLRAQQYDKLAAYISEYRAPMELDRTFVYSQNEVVDVLLQYYARTCVKDGIELGLRINVERDAPVADVDLCAVLGNLLENAVDACLRKQTGSRFIKLSITQKNSMLFIDMENSTDGNVAPRGSGFLSLKGHAGHERKGYGLESVRAVASRYAGEAGFECDNEAGVFVSSVLLNGATMRG